MSFYSRRVSIKRETHQADAIGLKTRVCDFVAVPEQFNSRRPESSVKSSPAGVSWVKVLVKCPITYYLIPSFNRHPFSKLLLLGQIDGQLSYEFDMTRSLRRVRCLACCFPISLGTKPMPPLTSRTLTRLRITPRSPSLSGIKGSRA